MAWSDDLVRNGITSFPTLSGQQRGVTHLEMYAPLPRQIVFETFPEMNFKLL